MAFVTTVPVDQARGEVRAMYEEAQARLGYVPNYVKLFGLRPPIWAAWGGLLGSIRRDLDRRRYELVTLAAARALRSSYCALAHGAILRKRFYSTPQLVAIADDYAAASLAPRDVAIMAFAEKVVRDASAITAEDVRVLRDHGLSDGEIVDCAAAAAARCFFSKLLDALGAEPDSAYAQLDEALRQRLTVGRGIATSAVERVRRPARRRQGPVQRRPTGDRRPARRRPR